MFLKGLNKKSNYSTELLLFLFYLLSMNKNSELSQIIGRVPEKKELDFILNSSDPELLFIYGRRRIGKTYLIHNYCGNKGLYFYFKAEENSKPVVLLYNFVNEIIVSLRKVGIIVQRKDITNWNDAFDFLYDTIKDYNQKIIILIDEFPWFCTKRSNFMDAFSYFWNKRASNHSNFKIFSTGSATSFMLNKIIKNKKGLFSRLKSIKMRPFTLEETHLFLLSRNIHFQNKKDLIFSYMIFGGVAQYLKEIRPGHSIEETINRCFCGLNPTFGLEFSDLFEGTFSNHDLHKFIVEFIGFSKKGQTQAELFAHIKKKFNERYNGSQIKIAFEDLIASDLISKTEFLSIDTRSKKETNPYYKISDEFLLFHSYWVYNNPMIKNDNYWSNIADSQDVSTWSGESFERLCLKNIYSIFKKMNIYCNLSGYWWKNFKDVNSKEIDLIVDRDDNTYSIVEIKYYEKEYALDSARSKNILEKKEYFIKYLNQIKENQYNSRNKKRNVNIIFITANGITINNFYNQVPISNHFSFIDLF